MSTGCVGGQCRRAMSKVSVYATEGLCLRALRAPRDLSGRPPERKNVGATDPLCRRSVSTRPTRGCESPENPVLRLLWKGAEGLENPTRDHIVFLYPNTRAILSPETNNHEDSCHAQTPPAKPKAPRPRTPRSRRCQGGGGYPPRIHTVSIHCGKIQGFYGDLRGKAPSKRNSNLSSAETERYDHKYWLHCPKNIFLCPKRTKSDNVQT